MSDQDAGCGCAVGVVLLLLGGTALVELATGYNAWPDIWHWVALAMPWVGAIGITVVGIALIAVATKG